MSIRFLLRRLATMFAVLLVLAATVFVLEDITPSNPIRLLVGERAPQSVVDAERKRLGYDRPLVVRFGDYVENAAHGDFGTSLHTRRPVFNDLMSSLTASLELVLFALLISVPLTLLFAVMSAARWRGGGALRLTVLMLAAVPSFLLAIAGILLFYKGLGWLPPAQRTAALDAPTGPTGLLTVDGLIHLKPGVTLDAISHLVLPALALSITVSVSVGRVLRGGIAENLRSDHVRAARARGLGDWDVIRRHCLRNSAGPVLAMSALQIGFMFGSLVVVEPIFGWPGVGSYLSGAIAASDFPAIAGFTLLLGTGYIVLNTVADLLHAAADPRINL